MQFKYKSAVKQKQEYLIYCLAIKFVLTFKIELTMVREWAHNPTLNGSIPNSSHIKKLSLTKLIFKKCFSLFSINFITFHDNS